MSCTIKCTKCGATAVVPILEDDYTTNSFIADDEKAEYKDAKGEIVDNCPHEEYDVIDVDTRGDYD